jgi:A/G-specific adenine glycosylase
MLQQTQVDRVIPKFNIFIQAFPTIRFLARAPFIDVMSVWSGLGYNRRALWLYEAAQEIVATYDGKVPQNPRALSNLKGIGPNTAAAICVYAFNQPLAFVETNIRAVYIHHFFRDRSDVHDNEIAPLVEAALDKENPREWYWALMDYGMHLKKLHNNPARKSKHHTLQSKFEGSQRQMRGKLLRLLLLGRTSAEDAARTLQNDTQLVDKLLGAMEKEGLLVRDVSGYSLK